MVSDKAYSAETRLNALVGNLRGLAQDVNGVLRYTDASGNAYTNGICHLTMLANTTITSNGTPQGIGLQYTVPAGGGTYRIRGQFIANQGAAFAGVTQSFGWTGPAVTFARIFELFANQSNNSINAWTNQSTIGGGAPFNWTTTAITQTVHLFYHGTITFSAGATFQPFGMLNSANQYTMIGGTYMDVEPV